MLGGVSVTLDNLFSLTRLRGRVKSLILSSFQGWNYGPAIVLLLPEHSQVVRNQSIFNSIRQYCLTNKEAKRLKIATKLAIVLIIITLGEKLSAQQTEVIIGCIVRGFAFVVNRTKA